MEAKKEQMNIKISKKDLQTIKNNANKVKKSLSEYIRTRACKCGEPGYEGIFESVDVDWVCGKCGSKNHWKAGNK